MNNKSITNDLVSETSPYLLQHAHNPVHWKPYTSKTLKQAKAEKKLMVISIGYAACHWCHVMEHESFEDVEVADVMNRDFISVKVDREERPDVDQIYINAVQLMTGSGGWPLNVVTLPDGRPVWGGTYFRKSQWIDALQQLQELYNREPEKLLSYANRLEKGLKSMDLISLNKSDINFKDYSLQPIIDSLASSFDLANGGFGEAPKFMMPNSLSFLLRYATASNNTKVLNFVTHTLEKMAFGGIYDQIDGGFSRYSVDERWHIPHFEKMLYDNALLTTLYANAYAANKAPQYKKIVVETLAFVEKHLTHQSGAFYSSLDADSINAEGQLEEGAYYTFTESEIRDLTGDDFKLFQAYYNINAYGEWENDRYVLIRKKSDDEIIQQFNIDSRTLNSKIAHWKSILSAYRNNRPKPRLDNKSLTSWNALMLTAYVDAYNTLGDDDYLNTALQSAEFLVKHQLQDDGSLKHIYKDGKSSIHGFLEDYAFLIEALINVYQVSFDWKWIELSEQLTDYVLQNFFDADKQMFYFSSKEQPSIIHRNFEYYDNVIPASNSVMGKNLFLLSKFLGKEDYYQKSKQMLKNVLEQAESHPRGFTNWLDLLTNFKNSFYEVVVTGPDAFRKARALNAHYLPNKVVAATDSLDEKPLFKSRFNPDKTLLFVCVDNTCQQPIETITETLKTIK